MAFSENIKLIAKEKSNFRCCICHKKFVQIHHIIPQSEGGSDKLENAAPLCAICHDLYGGNPEKRKQIREMRDHWWKIIEEIKESVKKNKNFDEFVIEEYPNPEEILLSVATKDKVLVIYHNVFENEAFETAAQNLFDLIKKTQEKFPDGKRKLYLDIEGHRNSKGGYDWDMYELQRYFILEFLSEYLDEINIPLFSVKTKGQSNNLPDKIFVK